MDLPRPLAYHHWLWRRFGDWFVESCTWEELSRDHGASHGSVANVAMHAVNMEDWYLHHVLPGKPWDGPKWDGFTSAEQMRARFHEVEARTKALFARTPASGWTARHRLDFGGGDVLESTLEDLAREVVSEAAHHRGEVLAMLWRMDKEPPYVSYLEWAAENP